MTGFETISYLKYQITALDTITNCPKALTKERIQIATKRKYAASTLNL